MNIPKSIEGAFVEIKRRAGSISRLLLAGGGTRLPILINTAHAIFGADISIHTDANPETIAVQGAIPFERPNSAGILRLDHS